jgi:hypothetical protein
MSLRLTPDRRRARRSGRQERPEPRAEVRTRSWPRRSPAGVERRPHSPEPRRVAEVGAFGLLPGRSCSAMCMSTPQEAQQDSDARRHTDRDQGAFGNHARHSVSNCLQCPIGSCCNLPHPAFLDGCHGNILSNNQRDNDERPQSFHGSREASANSSEQSCSDAAQSVQLKCLSTGGASSAPIASPSVCVHARGARKRQPMRVPSILRRHQWSGVGRTGT